MVVNKPKTLNLLFLSEIREGSSQIHTLTAIDPSTYLVNCTATILSGTPICEAEIPIPSKRSK